MKLEEIKEYHKNIFKSKYDRHVQMQSLFPSDLSSDSCVLDFGCGWGGVSRLFSNKYGTKVDAVDISQEALELASSIYKDENISFINLKDFEFPEKKYDLIFSSQVIEHVHNPGTYLHNISKMLKQDGYLLIGLPNGCNMNLFFNQLFMTKRRLLKRSKRIIESYDKAHDHINQWDMVHFTTLCASCGFSLVDYKNTEGTPIFNYLHSVPLIGKYIYKIPFLNSNISYTMFFLFKKEKEVVIGVND
ncbi:class I SAM-dependent methyltransferase [Vibrio fluvialis]|nr:class I SAM-dependent methyltransferase [Vibrio fluvialis]